jgi:uncharacterized LabA/DUF88 family protein
MAETGESTESRVAVYIDFDNVVISRYDQLHGRDSWRKDEARRNDGKSVPKLEQARVDFGAILDYASSFGTVALSRAYADWSVPANADMFRLPDITHVVIVAGDSDYIPLAQRCKRLGRVVIGIGVTGSTSPALVAALDEFESYDELQRDDPAAPTTPAPATTAAGDDTSLPVALTPATASRLLVRALDLARGKQDDDDWLNASTVKSQIKRLNPSFNEKSLGFRSFMDFVRANDEQVEIREAGQQRFMRLRETAPSTEPVAAVQKTSRRAGTKATTTKPAESKPAEKPAESKPEETKPAARAPRRAKAAASRTAPSASDPFREP